MTAYTPDRKDGSKWFIDNREFGSLGAAKEYLMNDIGFSPSEAIQYLKLVWGRH